MQPGVDLSPQRERPGGIGLTRRVSLGDRLASVFYLLAGLGLAGTGGVRFRMWAEDVAMCRSALAAATNAHGRMKVLYKVVPRPKMPGILQLLDRWDPLTCERYRERGAF